MDTSLLKNKGFVVRVGITALVSAVAGWLVSKYS